MALDVGEAAEILAEVIEDLGLAVVNCDRLDKPGSILLETSGHRVLVEIETMSTPTPARVSHIAMNQDTRAGLDVLHVLVSDRIPAATRAELRSHGWGWLDLGGHLHLAGHGLFIDAQVPAMKNKAERVDPFSGSVGLEVACALLMEPTIGLRVRDLARRLNRSPSAVSEVLGTFRRLGLAESDGRPAIPNLFWETAGAWRPREVQLADRPRLGIATVDTASVDAALQLGFDDVEHEPGWALTGSLAAAAYGAPVAIRSDHPPDFYVPSPAIQRRATRLLGEVVTSAQRRASVAIAPVPAVCEQRVDPAAEGARSWSTTNEHWPLAMPLFVALDLARDPGRGREILDSWHPPEPWRRVW